MADVIRFLNASDVKVLSVDIPSGISSDSGRVMGEAVRADVTVTFGLPKTGHFLYPGADHSGRLYVEDIGFPEKLITADAISIETLEGREISPLIPERQRYSHKGDYGHVLIIAGSRGKTGAALLAAEACLRSGAGLVTIGVPDTLADVFQARVTEAMVLPLADAGDGVLSHKAAGMVLEFLDQRADVLAIGPGITACESTAQLVRQLMETATVPMVLDADALNVLGGRKDLFRKVKAPVVLTPHAGEMARLLRTGPVTSDREGGDVHSLRKMIEENRIDVSRSYAKETGAYLVLKGAPAVIADPEGKVFINTTGNPGMATAGAGDVLTGMIAAFLGQGLNPLDASRAAVYLHGLAGDGAAETKGMHSLIASDIIAMLPQAFLSLVKHA
jgi:NAD(P)H-hydrate epimerase